MLASMGLDTWPSPLVFCPPDRWRQAAHCDDEGLRTERVRVPGDAPADVGKPESDNLLVQSKHACSRHAGHSQSLQARHFELKRFQATKTPSCHGSTDAAIACTVKADVHLILDHKIGRSPLA